MRCEEFGICGGCSLALEYQTQLEEKIKKFFALGFETEEYEVFASPKEGFRSRAEFRIYRDERGLHYAMQRGKTPVVIASCPILLPHLQKLLSALLEALNHSSVLSHKLFGVEVLGTTMQESMLVLLYHCKLGVEWEEEARKLQEELGAKIIGRSKGQKVVLSEEYLLDCVSVGGEQYCFVRYDNAFSQPNPHINNSMLEFALSCVEEMNSRQDLLELYCGGGNFTIPLSSKFQKVFATEVAKSSIQALKQNLSLNGIENIFCARLSGEESIEALSFKREFYRLKEVDLGRYEFSCVLVDPPRSGIGDREMLEFLARFENILYISCNPITLYEDLKILSQTHKLNKLALFDQFPYTHHLESGVWLERV